MSRLARVPFQDHDLSLLQSALARWISEYGDRGYCHVGDVPHRIFNGGRGRFPIDDIVRMWLRDGILRAFAIVQPRSDGFDVFGDRADSAAVSVAVRDASHTARRLMDAIGRHDQSVMTDVHAADVSYAELLTHLGFEGGDPWAVITERSLLHIPESPPENGFSIRSARPDEWDALAEVHSGAFGSEWAGEEYHQQVMTRPGYDPTRELVAEAPDGRLGAFTVIWIDEVNRVGLFEPVGTHHGFRRLGLARMLMVEGMRRMADAGCRAAQVGHELDNPASTALYRSLGFIPKHRVLEYSLPR